MPHNHLQQVARKANKRFLFGPAAAAEAGVERGFGLFYSMRGVRGLGRLLWLHTSRRVGSAWPVRPFLFMHDHAVAHGTACKVPPRAASIGEWKSCASDRLHKARGNATAFREFRAVFPDDTQASQSLAPIANILGDQGQFAIRAVELSAFADSESSGDGPFLRPDSNENGGNALFGRGDCPPNRLRAYCPRLIHPAGGFTH